jgi:hypothetical protein
MHRLAIAALLVSCGNVKDNRAIDAASSQDGSAAVDSPSSTDGSDNTPHLVFVTSTFHTGAMGGLAGADQICQTAATAATLPGTFKAWLANATVAPINRMTKHTGPYQLVSGTVVAQGFTDLTDGNLAHPIDRDEAGALSMGRFVCRGGEVWSNVDGTGGGRPGGCGGWTSATLADGVAGNVTNMDLMWTVGDCSVIGCASDLPIYCIEQ